MRTEFARHATPSTAGYRNLDPAPDQIGSWSEGYGSNRKRKEVLKMAETYGLEMLGLEEAAAETGDYDCSGCFTEIFYNRRTGQIHAKTLCGSTYTVYDDADIIPVCDATWKMTEQEIADAILDAVERDDMDKLALEQQNAMYAAEWEARRKLDVERWNAS